MPSQRNFGNILYDVAHYIIRKMLQHYAKHPGIIGYQVDNETANYGVANPDYFRSFVDHIKQKHKTTDSLNKLWGMNHWGMRLNFEKGTDLLNNKTLKKGDSIALKPRDLAVYSLMQPDLATINREQKFD
jgi:beta-galactosidase GanA